MTSASLPNIGFVGLGWPGERHAEAIIASSLGTVHSACDLNQERLERFATAFRPTRLFTDFAKMLNDPALDAVSTVGSPSDPRPAEAPSSISASMRLTQPGI